VPERNGLPLRILLAEDHPVGQRVATAMLENLGFHVDVVADGAEAVRAATVTRYDAILMDCQLPLIDGFEATAAIRQLQGTTRRTPIIAVTASDGRAGLEQCLAAGMDDFLTKPISLQTLAAVLNRWAAERSPVLDAVIIERLERVGRAAGEDLVGQLTTLFLDDAATQIEAIRAALATRDAVAIARSAHALSGSSANLGATHLAQLCSTLSQNGAAGDLADGAPLLHALEVELGRVRAALGSPAPAS
jgi:CheY-like chemotaxis protein/HPt (histidine-containing phosphotransfer) domain-containing protein